MLEAILLLEGSHYCSQPSRSVFGDLTWNSHGVTSWPDVTGRSNDAILGSTIAYVTCQHDIIVLITIVENLLMQEQL